MDTINLNQPGIYAITSPSGKLYVGSAANIQRRWAAHKRLLARGVHHCKGLQSAHLKYPGLLTYGVIEFCAEEMLIVREQHHMDSQQSHRLYNSTRTAGSNRGVKHSSETKEKMRAKALGRTFSPETREKLRAARKGRPLTEETKRRLSAALTGKKRQGSARDGLVGVMKTSNSSGYAGVTYSKAAGKWFARRSIQGKAVYLGLYETAELANQARQNFDRILGHYYDD